MTDTGNIVVATGDGCWRMEVAPAWGGALNSLAYAGAGREPLELIAGHANAAAFARDRYYRNIPLWPWVNRLAGGHYVHRDRDYEVPIDEKKTGTALHGFLYRLPVTKVEHSFSLHDAAITLRYDYTGDNPGYPFPARIQLRYAVHRDGFTLTFGVRNNHRTAVPVGIGWHPYFTFGEAVDELLLQLPPARRVLVDKRMLPVGKTQAYDTFAQRGPIGKVRADHCLVLEPGPGLSAVTRLWSSQRQLGIELWQRRVDFPYLHLFIPPDRKSLALEPLSCGIDAFNTEEGLRLLAPGAALTAQCGVRVFTD